MTFKVKFEEPDTTFPVDFGETQDVSDGGYERGYTAGYEAGRADYEVPSQEKTVSVTENGAVEILPDDGYVLSKAVVSVSVMGDLDTILKSGIKSINSEISSMRSYACYSMTSLETVNIPNVTRIESQTFRACTRLYKVNAPKVTYIDTYAFYTCSKLSKVDFPALTTIAASAFAISALLDTVVLRGNAVVNLLNSNAFTSTPIASGKGYVYVPDNLVDQYKKAANWSTYANQIKPLSEYKEG